MKQSKKQIWMLWLVGGLCALLGFQIVGSGLNSENFSLGQVLFGFGLLFLALIVFNIVRAKNIEEQAFSKVKREVDRLGYSPDESMEIAENAFRILKSGPGADFSDGLEGTLGKTLDAPLKNVKGANFTASDLKAAIELALMGHRPRE